MGRAGEVSLSSRGGDCCKDLGEHGGWKGKKPKNYTGGQLPVSEGEAALL